MSFSPIITVIMPNFNNEAVISRAIDSVLAQTFGNFELIIVDDGSTDKSLSIIKSYSDPRVKFCLHKNNQGLPAAWNTGIKESKTNLIAFLDSDDTWHPEKLKKQIDFLQRHPGITGCTTGYTHIRSGKTVITIPSQKETGLRNILFHNILHMGTTLLIQRSIFDQTGSFDEDLKRGQDTDWLVRCIQVGKLSVLPETLAVVYQHTQRSAVVLEESRIKMVEKHYDDLRRFGKLFAARKIAHMWADVAYQYEREGNREKMKTYATKSILSFPFQTPGIYLIVIDGSTGWKIKKQAVHLKHLIFNHFFGNK